MEKRINFIDIARGFAIIFIVFGHTITYSNHCDLIYKILCGFHVVLFFILSGYTFKIKENETFFKFIRRKFTRIMVPYFVWAILFLIPFFIFGQEVSSNLGAKANFELGNQLFNVLYGNGNSQALKQNTALWFLPALFSMEFIYYWIIKLIERKSKLIKILTVIPLLIIAFCVNSYLKFILPWGLNTVLVLGIFFYLGYLFREFNIFSKEKLFKIYYIIPMLLIGVAVALLNEKISAVNYRYGNLLLAFISGISLSITMIYISFIINKNKILEYVGKNTMDILIFHKLFILVCQTKLGYISKLMKNSNILIEMIIGVLVVILSILLSLMLAIVIRKFMKLIKDRVNAEKE